MLILRKVLSDKLVGQRYFNAGNRFGETVSYLDEGECAGFRGLLNRWGKWEEEYVRRGFRTISLEDFVESGRNGAEIGDLLYQKRQIGEQSVLHSLRYRRQFVANILPKQ